MIPILQQNTGGEDNNGDPLDEWGHHAEVPEVDDYEEGDGNSSANDLRELANTHYANNDFETALTLYTAALEAFEHERVTDNENEDSSSCNDQYIDLKVIYLCNRATCLFKLEMYEESRTDAVEAVNISNGKNAKAIYRLARAQLALKEYTVAIETLQNALDESNANANDNSSDIAQQHQNHWDEINKLLETAHAYQLRSKNFNNAVTISKLKSLKKYTIPGYTPSKREFQIIQELGEGNYSRVVAVQHIVTKEHFALKIIEKKKCEDLAKRQHPNVWNEIEMEKNILGERLWNDEGVDKNGKKKRGWCRRIVQLYYTFSDFGNLYFLEGLHPQGWDMWSTLRYKEKMVGTHASLAKVHLLELLEALEYIHERGIVHRDIKAENLLLSPRGHVILIDFGTAKDLIHTKYNGLEFVGTPDFMPPEAINGVSSPEGVEKMKEEGTGSDHSLDLWCFGVLAYQLLTGTTPFASPSQYLAYLKINRGNLCRPMGITDDDAWNLIVNLLKTDPKERLGADCFEYDTSVKGDFKMVKKTNGYTKIREHPYFANKKGVSYITEEETRIMPSLRDLCLRAVTELVEKDSTNLDIDKEHPQGGGSSHDMLRLNTKDRGAVMELLEKLRILKNPRVYRRFFKSKQEARLNKVRVNTRDFVGLTQLKDKQHQFPVPSTQDNVNTERSDVLEAVFPILYMHVSNPLFVKEVNLNCTDDERKTFMVQLAESLRVVNRKRPKLVVASGYLDDSCKKLLGKVNESIPVVLNNGESFFSFWSCGGQGIVLRSNDFTGEEGNDEARTCEQMDWIRELLEQSEVTRHHVFVFVDCEPEKLPKWIIQKMAKGRVLCMFGLSKGPLKESRHEYLAPSKIGEDEDMNDDDSQSSSSDHEDNDDKRVMKIIARGDSSIRCWKLEEYGAWNFEKL